MPPITSESPRKGSVHAQDRRSRKLALYGGVGCLLLLITPGALNLLIGRIERARYPVPGSFFEIEGRHMHIYCVGKGSPTVVFEAELGDDWLSWQKVQPDIAATTRACSYDRAGLGWSEAQSGPRDAIHVANQLHLLLQKAGETGPFILVGASAGGLYARVFTAAFPSDVAGIVFVDSATPEQLKVRQDGNDSIAKRQARHRRARWRLFLEASGWQRLMGKCRASIDRNLEQYAGLAAAENCRPAYATSWLGELDDIWLSASEADQAACCGNLPLVIVSRDPSPGEGRFSEQEIKRMPVWNSLQEHLKVLSTRSRRIIAHNSGHDIMIDRPDVVLGAIREVRNEIQGVARDEATNGSTTEQ